MCAAAYDWCAPTFTGECGEDCRPNARVNSALSYGGLGFEPTLADAEGAIIPEDSGKKASGDAPQPPPPEPDTHSALRNRRAN